MTLLVLYILRNTWNIYKHGKGYNNRLSIDEHQEAKQTESALTCPDLEMGTSTDQLKSEMQSQRTVALTGTVLVKHGGDKENTAQVSVTAPSLC